jgi:hypothetical protein
MRFLKELRDEWRSAEARLAIYACDGRPGDTKAPPWWQVHCSGRDLFRAARSTRRAIAKSAEAPDDRAALRTDVPWAVAMMAVLSMRKTLKRNAGEVNAAHGELIREALCLAVEAGFESFSSGDEFWVYLGEETAIVVRRFNARHGIDETRDLGRIDRILGDR